MQKTQCYSFGRLQWVQLQKCKRFNPTRLKNIRSIEYNDVSKFVTLTLNILSDLVVKYRYGRMLKTENLCLTTMYETGLALQMTELHGVSEQVVRPHTSCNKQRGR